MAHQLKLVSFELCPYLERSRIVLGEKAVPHELELIDLEAKPPWLLAVSPMGRVPILLVDGRPIFESMIINELLEELYPDPPLLPGGPLARAEARGWIVFANDAVMPATYSAMLALAGGETGDAIARPLGNLRDALGKVEAQAAKGAGPFLLGSAFTLADATYAPFFRRWRTVETWAAEARLLDTFPAAAAWADALLARPSAREAEPPEFASRLRQFFEERAAKSQRKS